MSGGKSQEKKDQKEVKLNEEKTNSEERQISEVERLKEELIAKQKELDGYRDKWMRALAEYENLKKRFEKEKLEFLQFSNEQLLLQLLPIIDDFDRAHEAAKNLQGEAFSKGVEMILNQLHKLLRENGVEKVKTVGEKFDPHVHEAIGTVDTDRHPEDTIAEEVSPGYTINGRLLRAARVKIYQNTKKEETKEKKEGLEKNGGEEKNG